jgi:hypothetical protein
MMIGVRDECCVLVSRAADQRFSSQVARRQNANAFNNSTLALITMDNLILVKQVALSPCELPSKKKKKKTKRKKNR